MKLKIKQSSWSGWTKDYKPEEVENEYEIVTNKKYIIKKTKYNYYKDGKYVDEEREDFSFEITDIKEDSITIHTFQVFSDNEGGTVNLRTDKKDFVVSIEKPLKLVTPTMDFGQIYILTLIK